jgi:nucleoside-diphosphate-sugar epimerase
MRKLIVGCGYLGLRVAERWLRDGDEVFATTRSDARAEEWKMGSGPIYAKHPSGRSGKWDPTLFSICPVVADVTQPATLTRLPPVETVLFAVGYEPGSGLSRHQVYVEGLAAVLDALDPATRRVIFISSTGVYGDTAGTWVDEDSPCLPDSEGGRAFLAAERVLAEHPLAERSVVLRMAGIYGPDRVPKARDLAVGKPLAVPAAGHVNLIHVDDAAAVVAAADARAEPPRTFLVSDGHPVQRREFYAHLAELLGCPSPRFVEPPAGDDAAGRGRADKRVRNQRMLGELGVQVEFADYRQGLGAIFREK